MKRISNVLTFLLLAVAPCAMAQEAGDIEVSLILGNSTMFQQSTQDIYLLPKYNNTSATPGTGIGDAISDQSADPGLYLNLSQVGSNNILNVAGIQGRYFLASNIDVNLSFAMNIYATPSKDYVEGVESSPVAVPAQRYIQGRLQSNLQFNVGGDYHFKVGKNNNMNAYAGANVGYQLGRIQTTNPYVGDQNGEQVTYKVQSQAGQVMAIQGSIVGGIAAQTNFGLVLGIEVAPVAYQYSVYQIGPSGFQTYKANHHSFKFFSNPQLKLGFRF
ncbi:MAG: hypothetical protein HUJ96_03395 [Marinilabiliaceae bacterium]|nr:hypothetical protein [Marinilabiliaceae bacterium]